MYNPCSARNRRNRLNMLLFSKLSAMESSTMTIDSVTHVDVSTNAGHTVEEMQTPLNRLLISTDELRSEYIDESFFTKRGIILQFVNNNCPGSTSMIGGMRLALTDVRRAPAYLSKYKRQIKAHAMKALTRHIMEMQCCIGLHEALSSDDYGMSFAIASVSPAVRHLNPSKRTEGPLFYCLFEGMVEPVYLERSNPNNWDDEQREICDNAHVINVHIHLLPATQRRSTVLREHNDKAAQAYYSPDATIKRQKMSPAPRNNGKMQYPGAPSKPDHQKLQAEITALKTQLSLLKSKTIPSPPLPAVQPLVWPPRDLCPALPDDL